VPVVRMVLSRPDDRPDPVLGLDHRRVHARPQQQRSVLASLMCPPRRMHPLVVLARLVPRARGVVVHGVRHLCRGHRFGM